MKKNLWIVAVVFALSALFAKEFAKPVLAQVRAALVQSVDEPGRTPFALSGFLSDTGNQFVSFTVPAGQRYVVEAYNGRCAAASGSVVNALQILGTTLGTGVDLDAPTHPLQNSAFLNTFGATGYGPLYLDAGSTVSVQPLGNGARVSCSVYITGHVINNP